jgi:hypothetical protein
MTLTYRGQKYEQHKTVQPDGAYVLSYRNVTYKKDNPLYAFLKAL